MQYASGTPNSALLSPDVPASVCGRNGDDGDNAIISSVAFECQSSVNDDDMVSVAANAVIADVDGTVSASKDELLPLGSAARSLPARKCAHCSRIAGEHRESAAAVTILVIEPSLAMHVQRIAAAVQGKHRCAAHCGHDTVNCRE